MKLKTILDSLDGVQEDLQAAYAEVEGKFVLQVDGIDEHPAVVALRNGHNNSKRERQEALDKLRDAEARLSTLPDDFDPDEFTRLKAEAEARQDDPEGKDVHKKIEQATTAVKQQYETKMQSEIKRRDERIEALEKDNELHLTRRHQDFKERHVTELLEQVGVTNPARRKGAYRLLADDVETFEEDGRLVARMKSDLGGDPVETYLKNWSQTDDGNAYVEQPKGSDATGGRGHNGSGKFKAADLGGTREQRTAALSAKFPELGKAG